MADLTNLCQLAVMVALAFYSKRIQKKRANWDAQTHQQLGGSSGKRRTQSWLMTKAQGEKKKPSAESAWLRGVIRKSRLISGLKIQKQDKARFDTRGLQRWRNKRERRQSHLHQIYIWWSEQGKKGSNPTALPTPDGWIIDFRGGI